MGVLTDNLTAATSRIQDVDVAQESTNFAKFNILVQAGTAMLAQANATPQSVLKLLQ
jgi:flagellin